MLCNTRLLKSISIICMSIMSYHKYNTTQHNYSFLVISWSYLLSLLKFVCVRGSLLIYIKFYLA